MINYIRTLLKRYGKKLDELRSSYPDSEFFKKGQIQEYKYIINQLVYVVNEPDVDLHHTLIYNVLHGEEQRMRYFKSPTTSDSTPLEQYRGQVLTGHLIISDLKEALAHSRKLEGLKEREVGNEQRRIIIYK